VTLASHVLFIYLQPLWVTQAIIAGGYAGREHVIKAEDASSQVLGRAQRLPLLSLQAFRVNHRIFPVFRAGQGEDHSIWSGLCDDNFTGSGSFPKQGDDHHPGTLAAAPITDGKRELISGIAACCWRVMGVAIPLNEGATLGGCLLKAGQTQRINGR
jgi:hypothetical protein